MNELRNASVRVHRPTGRRRRRDEGDRDVSRVSPRRSRLDFLTRRVVPRVLPEPPPLPPPPPPRRRTLRRAYRCPRRPRARTAPHKPRERRRPRARRPPARVRRVSRARRRPGRHHSRGPARAARRASSSPPSARSPPPSPTRAVVRARSSVSRNRAPRTVRSRPPRRWLATRARRRRRRRTGASTRGTTSSRASTSSSENTGFDRFWICITTPSRARRERSERETRRNLACARETARVIDPRRVKGGPRRRCDDDACARAWHAKICARERRCFE